MEKPTPNKIIPISDTQAAIGAGAIMLFFVAWVVIAGIGDDFVCWIGGKNNISGWVQAVGSLIAIAVAIYVPYKQYDNSKVEAKKLAISRLVNLYVAVISHLIEFEQRIGNEKLTGGAHLNYACRVQSEVIKEYLIDFNSIDSALLSLEAMKVALSLRGLLSSMAGELKVFAEIFEKSPKLSRLNKKRLKAYHSRVFDGMREFGDVLYKSHN